MSLTWDNMRAVVGFFPLLALLRCPGPCPGLGTAGESHMYGMVAEQWLRYHKSHQVVGVIPLVYGRCGPPCLTARGCNPSNSSGGVILPLLQRSGLFPAICLMCPESFSRTRVQLVGAADGGWWKPNKAPLPRIGPCTDACDPIQQHTSEHRFHG